MNIIKSYDPSFLKKIDTFSMFRSMALFCVLLTTVFLRQEVLGTSVILQLYAALTLTFLISLVSISNWQDTLRVRYYIQSQLFYDLLLVSYFVYLTGIDESIYLFLYMLNIVFTALIYQLGGALIVSAVSGIIYATIFYINTDTANTAHLYTLAYNELLFLLTALLAGQFMDELNKQRILLSSQQANIERLEVINNQLLNNMPAGIILMNEKSEVQKINKTALQLLSLAQAPENNIHSFELLPGTTDIIGLWKNLTEKQRMRYTIQYKYNNSKHKTFSIQLIPLSEEAKTKDTITKNYILIFQDISKVLELENKLEMESKLAAIGQLAAGIAHEIRNPLASISGSIETLNANLKLDNEEDKKLINISLREIKRLNKLITEFLEFAKPKTEHFKLVPVQQVITEVIDAIQSRGKEILNTDFHLSVAPSLSFTIDAERMKQVFFNLFINAIEANQERKKSIITISAHQHGNEILIKITDNGPGINQDIAKKIFDPFFTTKSGGTGLGLSTVAQIVKFHKGTIIVIPSSEGACFEISVPIYQDKNELVPIEGIA